LMPLDLGHDATAARTSPGTGSCDRTPWACGMACPRDESAGARFPAPGRRWL
jgi:hypothetical protein